MLLISFWFLLITPAQRSLQLGASILKFVTFPFDYIHFNTSKARLVELPEQYEHSSAKYYFTGEQGIYPVTSFMELRDIELTRSRI